MAPQFDPTKPFKIITTPGLPAPTPAPTLLSDEEMRQAELETRSWMDSVANFAKNWWNTVNPIEMAKTIAAAAPGASTNPWALRQLDKTGRSIYASHAEQFSKAKEAFDKGDDLTALGHVFAGVTPLVGPIAAHAGEQIAEGDYSGAAGTVAGLATPLAVKPAVRGVARAAEAAGPPASRLSSRMMTRQLRPAGGPNRVTMTGIAQDAAPTVAREPGLGATSRSALQQRVADALTTERQGLDSAYTAIPETTRVSVVPLRNAIKRAIAELRVKGSSNLKQVTGGEIEPAPVLGEINVLKRALKELQGVGEMVDAANLRKLREGWNEGARPAREVIAAEKSAGASSAARGWMKAADLVDEIFAKKFPEIAQRQSKVAVLSNADRALRAAVEWDATSTAGATGRRVMESAVGAAAGEYLGGHGAGAVIGGIITPIVDTVLTGGYTTQIGVARALARFADAMEARKLARAEVELSTAARTAGIPKSQSNILFRDWREFAGQIRERYRAEGERGSIRVGPGGERPGDILRSHEGAPERRAAGEAAAAELQRRFEQAAQAARTAQPEQVGLTPSQAAGPFAGPSGAPAAWDAGFHTRMPWSKPGQEFVAGPPPPTPVGMPPEAGTPPGRVPPAPLPAEFAPATPAGEAAYNATRPTPPVVDPTAAGYNRVLQAGGRPPQPSAQPVIAPPAPAPATPEIFPPSMSANYAELASRRGGTTGLQAAINDLIDVGDSIRMAKRDKVKFEALKKRWESGDASAAAELDSLMSRYILGKIGPLR